MKSKIFLCSLLCVCGLTLFAQAPKIEFPSASPACTIKQRVGLTDIEVVYSRPSMKGRQIFGNVVPFGTVWRTGANNATKITFSTPVKLNGTDVAAGSYALYTIPGEDEWTIILNSELGQWGAYNYDKIKGKDVLQVTVPVKTLPTSVEQLTIAAKEMDLTISWDKTEVAVPVKL